MSSQREFDIIVFGATGFTGKHVVREMALVAEKEGDLKWAVAGRSKSKLRDILAEVTEVTGKNVTGVTVIEADVGSQESLNDMCKRTKIVLNCVGPYHLYGEPVIKACIDNGTDQLDVSGEPMFLESMQLKYHEEAEKAKVFILGACGFDSVPCETGVQVLTDKFDGDVNHVEIFMKVISGPEGSKYSAGTWNSAISGVVTESQLRPLREKLFRDPLPRSSHPLKPRGPMSYANDVNSWVVTFPLTDSTVVRRTQYFNYHHRQLRPTPSLSYSVQQTFFHATAVLFYTFFFGIMCYFKMGRQLLAKFPSVFSLGFFSNDGPSRKQIENTSFSMTIVGHGYSERLPDPDQQHAAPPDKKLIVTVSGPEPGYAATPICLIQAAFCVLKEREKLPLEGGVLTPGAALFDTSLISRLASNGIKYDVAMPKE